MTLQSCFFQAPSHLSTAVASRYIPSLTHFSHDTKPMTSALPIGNIFPYHCLSGQPLRVFSLDPPPPPPPSESTHPRTKVGLFPPTPWSFLHASRCEQRGTGAPVVADVREPGIRAWQVARALRSCSCSSHSQLFHLRMDCYWACSTVQLRGSQNTVFIKE